ncbi:MAG: flagellar protein [Lachnospiraceae bacterium]|nr:flagellar protein [Lachnospiraceae bacterium]
MNVRNCRSCGCIFNYMGGQVICPACRDKVEKKFQEVKEYIRDNKGVGIQQVAEACEVDVGQIRQWLREERLELAADSALYLNCESCGQPIRSGRFCDKCKGNMTRDLQSILKSNQPAERKPDKNQGDSARMRFLK